MPLQLEHLNQLSCPTCGSHLIREERDQQHCNGHWNERQDFACGFSHTYSPNFLQVFVFKECPKNTVAAEKARKRSLTKEALNQVLATADVDDEFKSALFYGWSSL